MEEKEDDVEWIQTGEVSDLLGVGETTVREKARQGKLPAYKPFGHWRFKRSEIEEFREQQRTGGDQ